ncbi:MAG: CHRD domain-containing protein [Gemmatimonadota bacterium]
MIRVRALGTTGGKLAAALVAVVLMAALTGALAQAPSRMQAFTATLASQYVVPAFSSGSSGSALAILDGQELLVTGKFSLTSPIDTAEAGGAHIHRGGPTENGPVVFELDVTGTLAGTFQGRFQLSADQVTALENGEFYIQVHSQDHRSGEIRGQLTPQ